MWEPLPRPAQTLISCRQGHPDKRFTIVEDDVYLLIACRPLSNSQKKGTLKIQFQSTPAGTTLRHHNSSRVLTRQHLIQLGPLRCCTYPTKPVHRHADEQATAAAIRRPFGCEHNLANCTFRSPVRFPLLARICAWWCTTSVSRKWRRHYQIRMYIITTPRGWTSPPERDRDLELGTILRKSIKYVL